METKFRPLEANEIALLEKLLDHKFEGRAALRLELSSVRGRRVDEHGCLELRTEETAEADIDMSSPTEGRCEDIDGGPIVVMLHVRKGKLHLLEILKRMDRRF